MMPNWNENKHPRDEGGEFVPKDGAPGAGAIVSRITGEEIAPRDADIKTLREAARAWYDSNLRNTSIINAQSGRTVEFRKASKAFSTSANPDKLRLFPALPDVVAKGKIESSTDPVDKTAEPGVKAYHWLIATVELNKKPQQVGVTIREDSSGHLYYNHNPVEEKEKAPTDPRRSRSAHKAAGYTNGDAFDESIAPTHRDINLYLLDEKRNVDAAGTPTLKDWIARFATPQREPRAAAIPATGMDAGNADNFVTRYLKQCA